MLLFVYTPCGRAHRARHTAANVHSLDGYTSQGRPCLMDGPQMKPCTSLGGSSWHPRQPRQSRQQLSSSTLATVSTAFDSLDSDGRVSHSRQSRQSRQCCQAVKLDSCRQSFDSCRQFDSSFDSFDSFDSQGSDRSSCWGRRMLIEKY